MSINRHDAAERIHGTSAVGPPSIAMVVEAFRRRRALVGAIWFLIFLAFTAYGLVARNLYEAVVTVAPATTNKGIGGLSSAIGQLDGLAAMAGLGVGKDAATEEALAVLKSRVFTEKFLVSSGAMKAILADRYDGDPSRRYRVYKYFDTEVRSITQNRKTGLYTVSVVWTDRQSAAVWANTMVSLLNAEMRQRAIGESERNLRYLKEEVRDVEQVPVREAVNRLIEAQIKQRMLATVTQEYVFRFVDPAVAPNEKEYVFPQRILLSVAGLFVGGLIALFIAIVEATWERRLIHSTSSDESV